jgi:hypothetical protein
MVFPDLDFLDLEFPDLEFPDFRRQRRRRTLTPTEQCPPRKTSSENLRKQNLPRD